MSLSSDLPNLKNDLKNAINKASRQARINADKIGVTEEMTADDISSRVADSFSNTFAESLSVSMADLFAAYIKGATVTFKLANSGGNVTGEIKLT